MINDNLEIKIADFGISKIIGAAYNPSETVKDYMSIRYAAPEQLKRLDTNILSDLYSLGLVLAFLILNDEPPTDRKELLTYINDISVEGIRKIVLSLINDDIRERPQSGYKVHAALLEQKACIIKDTKKILVKCSYSATQKLYQIGVINRANIDQVRIFISADIHSYYGYKSKNKFYFIGDRIKYQCKLDRHYFLITDVHIIDTQISLEEEINKSIYLVIPWKMIDNNATYNKSDDIIYLTQLLTDHEAQKKATYNNDSVVNPLIKKWQDLLQEEYNLLKAKKDICDYIDFNLSRNGDKLHVIVKNLTMEIDDDSYVTMTLKANREQRLIGQFLRTLDDSTILINLDQKADLDEFSKNGTLGIDTIQEYVNLKRYSYALNQVQKQNTINPNIFKIINDPSVVQMNRLTPISKYVQDVFNTSDSPNALAVKKALATKDIFLLQGPPGTGKTTVIAEIICQILYNEPDAKILLTSQSHVAVDHAVGKVAKIFPDKCIIRIGRSERISQESEKLLYANKLDEWVVNTKNASTHNLFEYLKRSSINISLSEIKEYINTYQFDDSIQPKFNDKFDDGIIKVIELVCQWHKNLGKLDDFDEIFADKASVVAATCLGIASRNKLSDIVYDWVIIDEAARATPLETLVPLVKGKKTIMVGDHKQLPPVVKTAVRLHEKGIKKSDLEKSLFEELVNNISSEAKTVLTEQFRMHPIISSLISDVFYPEEGLNTKVTAEMRKHFLRWKDKAIIWLDTGKLSKHNELLVALSKQNSVEAKVILKIVEEIQQSYKKVGQNISLGIISGYNAQKNMLFDSINPKDTIKWCNLKIDIDNVDAFQGSEVDIGIYSIVRSNNHGELGFLKDTRRLNVALSRSRKCLIIVGDFEFVKNADTKMYNPFKSIAKFMRDNSDHVVKEVLVDE